MSTPLLTIDLNVLDEVLGGKNSNSGSSNIDGLLGQLNSITSSIKDINKKTSGLGNTEMMMLCMLALQNRPAGGSVVYVGTRRGFGCW